MKNIFSLVVLVAFAIVFSGCTASYQHNFLNQSSNTTYTPSRFLLVTPKSGSYGSHIYSSSGIEVVDVLNKELKKYTPYVGIIPVTITIDQINSQDMEKTDYVIIPQIIHWEDRLTGWSFKPDRIEVRFDIYNNQRQLIDSYMIQGRSAYIVWANKQPNSLLPRPIRNMLKELFNQGNI
jgi:hypothetical protein